MSDQHEEFHSFNEGDDPTQVLRVMEDYEHSRRQSLLSRRRLASDATSGRRESLFGPVASGVIPPRPPNFGSPSSSLKRVREAPQSLSKVPRLASLGPDPLEGLSALEEHGRQDREQGNKVELAELRRKVAIAEAESVVQRTRATRAEEMARKAEAQMKKERADEEERRVNMEKREKIAKVAAEEAKHQLRLTGLRETRRKEEEMDLRKDRRKELEGLERENERLMVENQRLEERESAFWVPQLREKEQESNRKIADLTRDVQLLRSRLDEATEKERLAEEWRENLAVVRRRLQVAEAEAGAAKREAMTMREKTQREEEAEVERKAMRDQLTQFPKLERENDRLKKENRLLVETGKNAALLEEEVAGLKVKLDKSEGRVERAELAGREVAKLQMKADEWEATCTRLLGREDMPVKTPASLESALTEMRKMDLVLRGELAETENRLKSVEVGKKNSEEKLASVTATLASTKEERIGQGRLIKKLQRKLFLVSKERDSFKGILDSYEHEITFTGSQFDSDKSAALEKMVSHYKDEIEKLESQLAASSAAAESGERLKEAHSRIEDLQAELEEARRASAEGSTSRNEKILHFRNNPTEMAVAERQKEVEKLREDNEALKARVKLLEEGHTSNLTMMVGHKVEEAASTEEVTELREQLKRADIRKERILDAFKKTSKDFREVCFELTGYRIDGLDNGQYRLTPRYSESEGDHLLFRRGSSGELLLLETRFSSQLSDLIDLHLNQQHSIPVFLAAVITDLFSRKTFETVEYQTEEEDGEEEEEAEADSDEGEEELEEEGEEAAEEEEEESEEEVGETTGTGGGDDDDPICID